MYFRIYLFFHKTFNKINNLNEELQRKKDQNENIKNEFDKLKKENDLLIHKNNDKENELSRLKLEIYEMKNNNAYLLDFKSKEKKLNKDIEEKQKNLRELNERNQILEEKNKNLEIDISKMKKKIEKLNEEIKQYELKKSKEEDLINLKNNMKKEINLLKKSNNDKDKEINKMKLEINNMKKDKEFSISLENKKKEIENKINYLEKKENDLKYLNEKYKGLQTAKGELEKNISDLEKKKNKLLEEIKQYKEKIINKNKIIEIIDIYKNKNNPFNNTNINEVKIFNNEQIQGETLSLYKMPTLIGLNNINSSTYINAILQCLSQTKDLTNYFLKEKNKDKIMNNNIAQKNPQEPQLCCVYYQLIHNLWNENKIHRSISPDNLINFIEKTKKSILNGDAKDCIRFILDQLHFELKKSIKTKVKFGQNNPENNLNQYDKNIVFNHFMDEFQNETSIITDLFYGFKETTNICQNCKISYNSQGKTEPICYNYITFNMLIFSLDEVMKYREEILNINNINMNLGNYKNVINLIECFYYDQKSQYFQGENRNYCVNCKQKNDSIYTSKILISPNILVIIVNRGKENLKLDFTSTMDISEFVLNKDKKEIYELYGVISNLDKSGQISSYVASCKSPIDGNWYRYNDDVVSPVNDFKKDVYNYGTPHVLFYEKQK